MSQRLYITLLTVLSITAAQAEDIILRLTPSEHAPIIARVSAETPAIQRARNVPDDTKQDWKWLEYTTTLDGYIPTSSLGKNFAIAPDTLIRTEPKSTARVLTTLQPKDSAKVTASGERWSTVRFRKAVPVYFRQQALPAYTANQVPGHALPQAPTIDPYAKTSNIAPKALKPENVKWRAAPAGTPDPVLPKKPRSTTERAKATSIMTGSADLRTSELPQAPEVQADAPLRNLVGTLVRQISSDGPHYPIRLIAPNQKQIAYVDMSQLFINDLRPFLGKTVQIIGEVRPIVPGSKDLIIQARTIRIAQ